jgi:hypothetical protein
VKGGKEKVMTEHQQDRGNKDNYWKMLKIGKWEVRSKEE